ncbi:transglutaminase-like domain-containing protein [Variovorax sp. VNK109]|jgi:transglutaminase-like putative cysteine protease|uniref:transglutaminase-like domain-containing protein n=1 Tax=Variovorax sp. VNK109 TaxID=3400919 RepID=UPI003BFC1C74
MQLSQIDVRLAYDVCGPAHFCFNLEAAQVPGQRIISEQLVVDPDVELRRFTDLVTGTRFLRIDAPKGELNIRYRAQVERLASPLRPGLRPTLRSRRSGRAIIENLPEVPVSAVPDEVLPYIMPTRYCQSDVMGRAARQLFGDLPPGLSRVQAISDWIHDSISYEPGSTDSTSTAQEVFVQRAGVCRDFAHLGVTFCRALNIPARFVVGYVWFDEPPQDFHAVFEAWLGDRWVLFDPTRMAPVENLVRVGAGRDAKDVAFSTIFGPVSMKTKELSVREYEAEKPRTYVRPGARVGESARRVMLIA